MVEFWSVPFLCYFLLARQSSCQRMAFSANSGPLLTRDIRSWSAETNKEPFQTQLCFVSSVSLLLPPHCPLTTNRLFNSGAFVCKGYKVFIFGNYRRTTPTQLCLVSSISLLLPPVKTILVPMNGQLSRLEARHWCRISSHHLPKLPKNTARLSCVRSHPFHCSFLLTVPGQLSAFLTRGPLLAQDIRSTSAETNEETTQTQLCLVSSISLLLPRGETIVMPINCPF